MSDTQKQKKKSYPRKRNKYKEYWEIGDAVPVAMKIIRILPSLYTVNLYSTSVPFCVFEFGLDYARHDTIREKESLLDLYTKQHFGWYKFTSADVWERRSFRR